MLYYLHQEVIGDQAERILDGADSRLVTLLLVQTITANNLHRTCDHLMSNNHK